MSEELRIIFTSDDVARLITYSCFNEKTTFELVIIVQNYRKSKGYTIDIDDARRRVASTLTNLEQKGAIKYSNTLWTTTPLAKEILSKYFGLS